MRAYHFLDVEKFNLFNDGDVVSTPQSPQQLEISGKPDDLEPRSSLQLITRNYYKGFEKLILKHEDVRRKSGRAYGEDFYFNRYVEDKSLNVYFNKDIKLLIIEGSKSAVNGAVKRFTKYFPDNFSVSRSTVDFPYLISHSSNVWGSWFGSLNTGTLRSAALFGDNVNLSEDFDRLKASGKLSSLNCSLTFERTSFDFTITSNKTVVLMQNRTPEEDIDLLLALRPILYRELAVV